MYAVNIIYIFYFSKAGLVDGIKRSFANFLNTMFLSSKVIIYLYFEHKVCLIKLSFYKYACICLHLTNGFNTFPSI